MIRFVQAPVKPDLSENIREIRTIRAIRDEKLDADRSTGWPIGISPCLRDENVEV